MTESTMRNGGKVAVIVGRHTLTVKHGTITLAHRVESADVWRSSGYTADIRMWKLTAATSAHAGFEGSGRFAAVGMPNGIVLARQEG